MVRFELKQAARKHCPEAMEVVARCLHSDDARVALLAAQILFERAYGKPARQADIEATHRFVVAPQTMALDEWLANKGQPKALPSPDDTDPKSDDDDPGKLN
jgi:hypothetical protein